MRQGMLDSLICIDFEASSLENGYPIEVGVSDAATGNAIAWLIRPPAAWLTERIWSPASEAVHGIGRAQLEAEGAEPAVVCTALEPHIIGKKLVSDNPPFDRRWLDLLLGAGGLQAVGEMLDFDQVAWGLAVRCGRRPDIAWVKAEAEVWAKVPTVHRAGPDALRNALMLRHIAAKGP